MTNSRDKGKKGELELVHFLKDFGYDVVVRAIEKGVDDGSAQLNEF